MAKTVGIHPDLKFYREREFQTEKRFRDYLTGPRCRIEPKPILRELDDRQAKFLPANNPKARRNFASVASRHFQAKLKDIEGPAYLVTFAFREWAYNIKYLEDAEDIQDLVEAEEADELEVSGPASLIRELLRGRNFLGMFEVAFYGNFRRKPSDIPIRLLSRHAHFLLWGISKRQLSRIISDINSRYRSLLKGMPAADFRTIKPNQEIKALLYTLKSPAWEYRIYRKSDDEARPREGRLVNGPLNSPWVQRTRWLRPGDQAKVHRALRNCYLDKLAFAGGEGVDVLKAIHHDALKHFRRSEDRRTRNRLSSSTRKRRGRRGA